jgi:hypothetical protein
VVLATSARLAEGQADDWQVVLAPYGLFANIEGEAAVGRIDPVPVSIDTVVNRGDQWGDPVIGTRILQRFSDKVFLIAQGDIGGFGVGSDFSWNLQGGLGYDVTERLAQELEPRAYATSPVGFSALIGAYSRSDGGVVLDPTLPVEDVTAGINGASLGYFQTFGLFGRLANVGLVASYAWGSMEGLLAGEFARLTRSGLGDPRLRFATNLTGAPSLEPRDFAGYRQKTNLGLSLALSAPLGQYDPAKLINLGTNRWAFKPELGLSHRRGHWLLEMAGGVWLYTTNNRFFEGTSTREQEPVFSFQGHIIRDLPKGTWISFNTNLFTGGKVRVDSQPSVAPPLRNSRLGVTYSFPFHRRHSLKVTYSNGIFTRFGGDFSSIAVVYQFVWLRPR